MPVLTRTLPPVRGGLGSAQMPLQKPAETDDNDGKQDAGQLRPRRHRCLRVAILEKTLADAGGHNWQPRLAVRNRRRTDLLVGLMLSNSQGRREDPAAQDGSPPSSPATGKRGDLRSNPFSDSTENLRSQGG